MEQQNVMVGDYVKVKKHLKAFKDGANRVLGKGTEGIVVEGTPPGMLVVDFGPTWGKLGVEARYLEKIATAFREIPVEVAYRATDGAA